MKCNLKQLRMESDITLRALSERTGISANHLSRIELGTSDPTCKTMCRIAWALRRNVWEVFECDN